MKTQIASLEPRPPVFWRFLLAASLVPLALALSILWLRSEYDRGEQIRSGARESYNHRIDVITLLSTLRHAETSQRGYVITGDPEFRAQYATAKQRVEAMLELLQQDQERLRARQARLVEVAAIAADKIVEMDDVLQVKDTQGQEAAHALVTGGEGKALMSRFQATLDRMIAEEEAFSTQGVADFSARAKRIQMSMWIFVGLVSLALLLALVMLWRQRREQYLAELSAFDAAERNRAILNSTVDAIVILNPSGTIETLNPAATAMLGYQPDELRRRDIGIITNVAPGSSNFAQRIGLVDGVLKTAFHADCSVRHRDGRPVPVDIALGVMPLADGDHLVMSFRDIAERKRLEQLKDDLISTVSHELRTPLTSIVGAIGLLGAEVGGKQSEQGARLIQIAENNSRRLIRLINDMLDVDRIESGKLRMTMRPISLSETVRRACDDSLGLAIGQNVKLICAASDDNMLVIGDPDRLMQVVANLISNALKVTSDGGVVTAGTHRDAAGCRVTAYVDDDGPGVPEEFRKRIFGRFERAIGDEGSAGTGLGLAIAREIVTQHGGDIWFEDRPGGGARFAFAFPVAPPADVSRAIDSDTKILICERDPAVARDIQAVLAEDGYDCRTVHSAAAARAALDGNGYTILLLDMALDDADAFELARDVRNSEGPDKLSILLLSPFDSAAESTPVPLDLIDWIAKPIDAMRVKKAVRAALPQGKVARPVVLHLDDDQDTLDITAEALGDDAEILKARTLAEARGLLQRRTPHIAILDIHLEEGTGLDLLHDLVDQHGVAVPTIIYSAHDVGSEIVGQVDAVLTKSRTSMPDLKATIRRVVATRHPGEPL